MPTGIPKGVKDKGNPLAAWKVEWSQEKEGPINPLKITKEGSPS